VENGGPVYPKSVFCYEGRPFVLPNATPPSIFERFKIKKSEK